MADAGRVIAGSAKGVRLEAPGPGTRPLADRVKQTLFAILDPELGDAVVADLFAGSGAAGIEALSRGAARATFVERHAGTARVLAGNLRRARVDGQGKVVGREVLAWLDDPAGAAADGPFDLVVVDPPYEDVEAMRGTLDRLGAHVRPGGVVVAKHFWRDALPPEIGLLASERERRFGETALTFYRRPKEDPER